LPPGKVFIAGSGPGSFELITKRAIELIEQVDVILFDELIGAELRNIIEKSGKEVVDVGKRAGKHKKKQDETNRLLIEYAKKGKNVLRIKGGDPFIFGRGGEEAEVLAEAGIKFEIVPGVTSAIAAPAYAGIPVTHRGYDPAVVFLTGKEAPGRDRTNWEALAKLNATIVILMGVANLRRNAERLMKHGKSPDTPVAIIEKGCTKEQRVVTGRLRNIADIVEKEGVKAPAVIVIGNVVNLREKLLPFLDF
jgi:uroporphyrin-III C-methyltransferase